MNTKPGRSARGGLRVLIGIAGERIGNFLPFRPGPLCQPEGPQRPGGTAAAQQLVQEELGFVGLRLPRLTAVRTHEEAVIGGDPAVVGVVEPDRSQPAGVTGLLRLPVRAPVLRTEKLSG